MEHIERAKKAVQIAKVHLAMKTGCTFFIALCTRLQTTITESIPTAATNGAEIKFNPQFFLDLNKEERIFLLLHETLHVAYDHMGRKNHFDHTLWNKACDFVINDQLIKQNFTMPKGGLHDTQYRDMSAEQVYELLKKDEQNGGHGNSNANCPWDDLMDPADPDADSRAEAVKDMLVQAATQAKMSDDWGSVPGELQRLLDEILNPLVPWNVVLARFMREKNKDDYSWRRPNRRHMPKFYLPSLYSEALERVDFAIDTSGSIGETEFKQFVSELYHVLKHFKPKEIGVVQFDHCIQSSVVLNRLVQLQSLEFKGGGGTELSPVIEMYTRSKAKFLVVLTDGYFDQDCLTDPNKQVVWVVYNNASFVPKFGKVVHFKLKQ